MDKYVLVPRELVVQLVDSLDRFCIGDIPHMCDEDRLAVLKDLLLEGDE